MTVDIVIGANAGDEGKGSVVDRLARIIPNPTVVRFNGGAQAAHTVQHEGVRTVFHHFGSGTLAGAPTYLGPEFIINPILYNIERKELNAGVLVCHPDCRVSTPYDMMYNQLLEKSRGDNKHGSCGLGINATVDRHEKIPFTARDLEYPLIVHEILLKSYKYMMEMCVSGGLTLPENVQMVMKRASINQAFMYDCFQFVQTSHLHWVSSLTGNLIFEGAQGLILDEHHEWFPYVTRSRTGLPNVIAMLTQLPEIPEINVTYVTRAYMTRHGAGPFPTEQVGMHFEDPTNIPNEWQDTLRFGYLDLDQMLGVIAKDMDHLALLPDVHAKFEICVTCMDQVEDTGVRFKHDNKLFHMHGEGFLEYLADIWNGSLSASYGPEAKDTRHILDYTY